MERRRFLKDAAQIGVGLGIAGTLSAEQTAPATLLEPATPPHSRHAHP